MSTPEEHVVEMEEAIDRFSKDQHVKAPDIFTKYEELRFAMHDFRKVVEQDDDGNRNK